ncbi:glycosyltransferase family 1 protein, partial [Paraburkholderia sp. LEh10]|nr:glycosyltransferase family 1 protein [Paraburkholderia sp. LEh10]
GKALDGSMKLPDADACRAYARANFDNPVIAARVASIYHEAVAVG